MLGETIRYDSNIRRFAEVFERQGNRNPLIDHPEWAARIDFGGPAG